MFEIGKMIPAHAGLLEKNGHESAVSDPWPENECDLAIDPKSGNFNARKNAGNRKVDAAIRKFIAETRQCKIIYSSLLLLYIIYKCYYYGYFGSQIC